MIKILAVLLATAWMLMTTSNAPAQNIGIGTNTPNANALLDLSSQTKDF